MPDLGVVVGVAKRRRATRVCAACLRPLPWTIGKRCSLCLASPTTPPRPQLPTTPSSSPVSSQASPHPRCPGQGVCCPRPDPCGCRGWTPPGDGCCAACQQAAGRPWGSGGFTWSCCAGQSTGVGAGQVSLPVQQSSAAAASPASADVSMPDAPVVTPPPILADSPMPNHYEERAPPICRQFHPQLQPQNTPSPGLDRF